MTEYNPKNRYNRTSDQSSRIQHIDQFLEDFDNYDEYEAVADEDAPVRHTSSSARRTSSGSSGRSSSASRRSSYDSSSERPRSSSSGSRSSSRSSSGRSGGNSIKRKKKKFKKLFLGYIAVLVVLLIVMAIVLSIALRNYENGQSFHTAESIAKSYSSQQGIIDFVKKNADKTSILDNVDNVAEVYATNIAGKEISYIESSDSLRDAPAYYITADGETVAKVILSRDSKSSRWEIAELDIGDYLPDTMTITIEAPKGSSVVLNGNALSTSYITNSGVPAVLQGSVNYIEDVPEYDTYKLSGLVSDPEISVTDPSGKTLRITQIDSLYIAGQNIDQDEFDAIEDRVYDTIWNYATYFIHMSYNLYNYIVYGSELYSYIFGSDTMDKIDTNLYNWEYIDHYDFAKESADNYVFYTNDCFTVDIEYALDMYFTDPSLEDENQKMDATWVFVIEPLDGSWCIGEITSRK